MELSQSPEESDKQLIQFDKGELQVIASAYREAANKTIGEGGPEDVSELQVELAAADRDPSNTEAQSVLVEYVNGIVETLQAFAEATVDEVVNLVRKGATPGYKNLDPIERLKLGREASSLALRLSGESTLARLKVIELESPTTAPSEEESFLERAEEL